MYSINIISVVEINFFDNLRGAQVLSNIYLPEKISTCPKNGTLRFKVYLEKGMILQKTLIVSRIKFLCAIVMIMWCNK